MCDRLIEKIVTAMMFAAISSLVVSCTPGAGDLYDRGGAGDLAAGNGPIGADKQVLLCPTPGEMLFSGQPSGYTCAFCSGTTLFTCLECLPTTDVSHTCVCYSNGNNPCLAGQYCGVSGCISYPSKSVQESLSFPLAAIPCPNPGESNLVLHGNACGCATASPVANCTAGQSCGASGCESPQPTAIRRVFVTNALAKPSVAYVVGNYGTNVTFNTVWGTHTLPNSVGADDICMDAAKSGNLGGLWMAWMEDTGNSAWGRISSHISPTDTKYVYLVDGKTQVSKEVGPPGVVSGTFATKCGAPNQQTGCDTLMNPIFMDENKQDLRISPTTAVWTGILQADSVPSTVNCSNWSNYLGQGVFGNLTKADGSWHRESSSMACTNGAHLYCIEVDHW